MYWVCATYTPTKTIISVVCQVDRPVGYDDAKWFATRQEADADAAFERSLSEPTSNPDYAPTPSHSF